MKSQPPAAARTCAAKERPAVEELLRQQQQQWEQGLQVPVEFFQQQYSGLTGEDLLDLVYQEILLREQLGHSPCLAEYLTRFAPQAVEVRRLFEVHQVCETPAWDESRRDPSATGQGTADTRRLVGEKDRKGTRSAVPAHDSQPSIAGYEILERVGQGGMGVVFRARHVALNRIVALKMVASESLLDDQKLRRFRAEARTVAQLQHPHIAQLYEAGEVQGRPWLALEYIEGGTLSRYLQQHTPSVAEIAQWVATLADAVHYSHEHGIIHRDLKPANILMTRAGSPKITDFGLAKWSPWQSLAQKQLQDGQLEDGQLQDKTGAEAATEEWAEMQTRTGEIMGTPNYMAPEQAMGNVSAISPRTDVYSLGAVLYELLVGRPPFRGLSAAETLVQVATREPLAPLRLQPRLPRDLNTICLKCLEKSPQRRYESAAELAADLRRFLAARPISARPAGVVERSVKWIRRQPFGAALIAVCLLAATAAGIGLYAHQARLQREVRRSDARYQKAHQTLQQMLAHVEETRFGEVPQLQDLRGELLQESLSFYQDILQQDGQADAQVRFHVACALHRTGTIQLRLNRQAEARENYLQGIALLQELLQEQPSNLEYRGVLSGIYNNLGTIPAADDLEFLRKSLAEREEIQRQRPDYPKLEAGLAESHDSLGAYYHRTRQPDEARRHYQAAIDFQRRVLEAAPKEPRLAASLAETLNNMGTLLAGLNQTQDAAAAYAEAESLLKPLADAQPHKHEYAISLASIYLNWGALLSKSGSPEAGLERLGQSIALLNGVLALEPHLKRASEALFNAHGARAMVYYATLKRYADAIPDWEEVVRLSPPEHRDEHRVHLAINLALAGELPRAVEIAESFVGADASITPASCFYLAGVCSVALAALDDNPDLPATERAARVDRWSTAALSLLEAAEQRGYFAKPRHLQMLREDSDYAALRQQPRFHDLLQRLEVAHQPAAEVGEQ